METCSVLLALCAAKPPVGANEFLLQRARNADLNVFFDVSPKQTVEQTFESPVIWDALTLIMASL